MSRLLTDKEIEKIIRDTAAPEVAAIALHDLLKEARAIAEAQRDLSDRETSRTVLAELLPSESLFTFDNYPQSLNEGINEAINRAREWLVNPPGGKYTL